MRATDYSEELKIAVKHFWDVRMSQVKAQKKRGVTDTGNRSAVTGGKQMDGFIELFAKIAVDLGIPDENVITKSNHLPGYFRPSKNWDLIITSPKEALIAVLELKSHVGSFGNNFNNRTEEALGYSVDIHTAFEKNTFPQSQPFWLGYLTLVEKNPKSSREIRVYEPHFKVMPEFHDTSYLDRYKILCERLMQQRMYDGACVICSTKEGDFGNLSEETSFEAFTDSYIGFLQGKLREFEK